MDSIKEDDMATRTPRKGRISDELLDELLAGRERRSYMLPGSAKNWWAPSDDPVRGALHMPDSACRVVPPRVVQFIWRLDGRGTSKSRSPRLGPSVVEVVDLDSQIDLGNVRDRLLAFGPLDGVTEPWCERHGSDRCGTWSVRRGCAWRKGRRGRALCYRPRSMLSVSNALRLSSSGISASQPYAVATVASSTAWASASHCGRAL